jgi:hypothetical protein
MHKFNLQSPAGAALVRYSEFGVSYVMAAALRVKHENNILFKLDPQAVAESGQGENAASPPVAKTINLDRPTSVLVEFHEDDRGVAKYAETHTPEDRWGLLLMGFVAHRRRTGDGQNFQWTIEPLDQRWISDGKRGQWLTGQSMLPIAPSARFVMETLPSAWAMTVDLLTTFGGVDVDAVPTFSTTPKPVGLEVVMASEIEYRRKLAEERQARMQAVRAAKDLADEIRKRPFKIADDPALAELLSAIRAKR